MDRLRLKTEFYSAYDASYITGFASRLAAVSEAERRRVAGYLGEGSHFQSFTIQSAPLPLVVNLAKQSFMKRGSQALAGWRRSIATVKQFEDVILAPPMEVVSTSDYCAMVMPKGETVRAIPAVSLNQLWRETQRALADHGLLINDYPQYREAMGVPFIIDWSDLTILNSR